MRHREKNIEKRVIITASRNGFNFVFSSLFPAIDRYVSPNLKLSGTMFYMPKKGKK
jgi:hypothetical protein